MKKRALVPVLILTVAFMLPLGSAGAVFAVGSSNDPVVDEPAVSISLSPGILRMSLDPGETKTAEITVINSGNIAYDAKVFAATYAVAPDYSNNVFEGDETIYSQIYRWISFKDGEPEESFNLGPGERKTVGFTIAVPESVPAGGQHAGIMAQIVPPDDAAGVIPVRRVASLLYARVNGDTIDKGEVTERSWRGFYSGRDIDTSLTIKNTGNTDFAVENRLVVMGLFGNLVDEVTEPPMMIFPETSRTFELKSKNGTIGIYRLTQESRFLDQTFTETRIIFVTPIWLVLLAYGVTIAVIVLLIFYINKRRKGVRYAR